MDFIQSNKDDVVEGRKLGVELICRVLQVAPSTYYAARDRAPSARTLSDAVLSGELYSLWEANRKVYGVRKLWKTARLMRSLGIEGVKRSRTVQSIDEYRLCLTRQLHNGRAAAFAVARCPSVGFH